MKLKIDFSEIYKHAGEATWHHVMINGRGGEATWQPVERPIMRGIKTVDPHLKSRVRGVI